MILNGQIANLNNQLEQLKAKAIQPTEYDEEQADYEILLKEKNRVIVALQDDIEVKINQLEEIDNTLANAQKDVINLKEKIAEMNAKTFVSEGADRYYPAREIKQKVKTFLNLRFIKNHFNEYGLEKYSLKERVVTPLAEIELKLHDKNKDCILIKSKGKTEIFESEFAKRILEEYNTYRIN